MAPPASSSSSSKPSGGRSLRSAPPASHPSATSRANAAFQHLNGPVQKTLNEFTRLFQSIQSSAFLGKPLTETLISKVGGARGDEEDEEEEEGRKVLGQAKEEIKANKLTSFAPYPHLVPLPPLSTTPPSTLLPYQKLNLASTLLILQFISILPLTPASSSKRKRGRPPLVDPNASSSSTSSDELKEGEEMMRELKKGLFGGVMSLVQPEDAWEGGEDWLEKSAGVNLGKTRKEKEKGGVEGAMAEGKERKRRRTEGWKERLEVMLEVCTAIVLLSNPTDSSAPIDSIHDPRIQEIFKGDFLDDDDGLVARASFKGPSGAVFRDSNERRVVSGTMWKKASIARAVLLNNLTPEQMNAKYPLDKMAQLVGSYLVARLWLPFLHLEEQSTSNPKPFSFLNPNTPGRILTGKDFGGPPTPPPVDKKEAIAARKKAAAAAAKSKAPAAKKSSKKVAAAAEDDDEEEEGVVQEGSSLDEIDHDLAPSAHADDDEEEDDEEDEEPVELSEKAKGKRSTRLVPAEEEDDDEEESDSDSDSSMIEILDEASSDSDDPASDAEEDDEDIERESGITEADLVGFVARDPGEEEGLSRRELTPLRRSLAKDRRLPENKRVKETGAALPKALVQMLEEELAKGKSAEQIVATISKSIKTLATTSSPSKPNPKPSTSKSKASSKASSSKRVEDEDEEEEDTPPPKLTPAQLAKQEKLRIAERNRILQLNQGDEEDDDDEMIVVEEEEEEEDGDDPMALLATPKKKSNSFMMPSGYQYATGGNQRGRKNWTAEEDKCLLDAMKLIYPQSKMWSKVIALHGINGVDSTVLKDRNVQSCKDRARNIKTQMLKGGKVPPEYLSSISVDKATQAILDRRNGVVVDDPAFAPVPRAPRVVAEDDGEEEID